MNLRELEYIIAVANLGHFGKAARACHVSQPTLSSQIRKLEAELGTTIFERMYGAVRVTEQGEAILEAAHRAVHAKVDIFELARSFQDPFSGELTLGVIPTIGPYLVPMFSGQLLRQYPKLNLTYIEDTTDRLNDLLRSGEMDVAILATSPIDTALEQIPLYDEKFLVALPKNHALCAQEHVSLKDLEDVSLLLLTEGHCLRDQTLSVCSMARHNQAIRANSLDTLLGLVSAGHGVTLLPTLCVRKGYISDLGIVLRPIIDAIAVRRVNLTFRSTNVRKQLLLGLTKLILSQVPDTVAPISISI